MAPWPVASDSAHPLRGATLCNDGLHNAELRLIRSLILYHSFARKAPPQAAVETLNLDLYLLLG